MTEAEVLAWLEDLSARGAAVPVFATFFHDPQAASAWLGEAETALASSLPAGHPIRRAWVDLFERVKAYKPPAGTVVMNVPYATVHFAQARGLVQAARTVIKEGRLTGVLEGVRADTVSEVLDQAEALLRLKHSVAAAVLAGGALETHLLHVCQRTGLTWTGDGSIGKYDQAVAQARNSGKAELYTTTDSKLIGGWGGMRNDAAHDPTNFAHTDAEVGLMIQGVRQFLARVP